MVMLSSLNQPVIPVLRATPRVPLNTSAFKLSVRPGKMSSLSKKEVHSEKVPQNQLFSQALVVGGMVYVSGNTGVDPATGNFVEGTVINRATQILKNISSVLEATGSHIDKTVKVNIFLTSMSDYGLMNEAYANFFNKQPKPIRTCVAVKELPRGTDVEMEVTALL